MLTHIVPSDTFPVSCVSPLHEVHVNTWMNLKKSLSLLCIIVWYQTNMKIFFLPLTRCSGCSKVNKNQLNLTPAQCFWECFCTLKLWLSKFYAAITLFATITMCNELLLCRHLDISKIYSLFKNTNAFKVEQAKLLDILIFWTIVTRIDDTDQSW